MKNYLKLKTYSPFSYSYIFLDCDEYLADQLFIKHKVPVKFRKEFIKESSEYRIICCRIRKKYEKEFLTALSEMYNKMILRGFYGYQEFCDKFNAEVLNTRGFI